MLRLILALSLVPMCAVAQPMQPQKQLNACAAFSGTLAQSMAMVLTENEALKARIAELEKPPSAEPTK